MRADEGARPGRRGLRAEPGDQAARGGARSSPAASRARRRSTRSPPAAAPSGLRATIHSSSCGTSAGPARRKARYVADGSRPRSWSRATSWPSPPTSPSSGTTPRCCCPQDDRGAFYPRVTSDDMCWFLGLYLGDGYLKHSDGYTTVGIAVDKTDTELVDEICDVAKRLFGLDFSLSSRRLPADGTGHGRLGRVSRAQRARRHRAHQAGARLGLRPAALPAPVLRGRPARRRRLRPRPRHAPRTPTSPAPTRTSWAGSRSCSPSRASGAAA